MQAIIGNALTDTDFRAALLNGSRQRVLQAFDLTNDETAAIMAIRADSLEQFAGELHHWLVQAQGQYETRPLPLVRTWPSRRWLPTN
jgi:hypothetical protein